MRVEQYYGFGMSHNVNYFRQGEMEKMGITN